MLLTVLAKAFGFILILYQNAATAKRQWWLGLLNLLWVVRLPEQNYLHKFPPTQIMEEPG